MDNCLLKSSNYTESPFCTVEEKKIYDEHFFNNVAHELSISSKLLLQMPQFFSSLHFARDVLDDHS